MKKISIVTPSYNQGHFIEETITSVLDQGYPDFEYIIIDGGSSDNTVDIIKKYEKHLKYWVSEKDTGQTNAINKGLKYCTGEIFNWLNSDDYLETGALQKIASVFEDDHITMVAGKVRNFSSHNAEVIQNQQLSAEGLMCWKKDVKFVQPGVWLLRELIDKAGGIDERFQYSFDWDLYIRYLYHFPIVKEIDELLVHFRLHDDSKTQSAQEKFEAEQRKIIEKLSVLNEYSGLHNACIYKIQKTSWTGFLSDVSKKDNSFLTKLSLLRSEMKTYRRDIVYSRQTAGAVKAFLSKKQI